jgi:hypothetical protein
MGASALKGLVKKPLGLLTPGIRPGNSLKHPFSLNPRDHVNLNPRENFQDLSNGFGRQHLKNIMDGRPGKNIGQAKDDILPY